MIRIFCRNSKDIKLGRWEHRISKKKESIKSVWANFDNCGDIICSQPTEVKKILQEETNNQKNPNQ